MLSFKNLMSLCLLVVFVGTANGAGQAEQDADGAVTNVVSSARAVWKYGKSARKTLQALGREHRKAGNAVRVMRRQLRKLEAADAASDAEKMNAECLAFVVASAKLAEMGLSAGPAIDKATAAEEDKKVKDILAIIERPAYDALAAKVIAPFVGHGTFDGMFKEHSKHKAKLRLAFLRAFSNREGDLAKRLLAGEGVAQFTLDADQETKDTVIAKVSEIREQADEAAQVKDRCVTILTRLGSTKIFDGLVKARMDAIAAEYQKGAKANGQVILGSLQALITLHMEVKEYRKTALFFSDYMQQVLTIPMAQLTPQGHQQISIQCYNFACVLSRINEIDFGLWALEESYNYGYTSWDWAQRDGDLENLRKDKRFMATLTSWKDGTKKPASMAFDQKSFGAFVKKISPKKEAAPAPTSKPVPKEEEKKDS
ncbi:MAG: hypothetical protein ACI97A_002437 [Planctomycetota bacterium]|jgi:hypothetical protein